MMQYQNVKKNPTTAVLLALFLGGIGIHKFYLNQVGAGIVYLLFCWTCIPEIIAFIEAFTISGTVGEYNEKKATEIAVMLGGQIR
jgi:TM2 domain-containing membrane protein YozV